MLQESEEQLIMRPLSSRGIELWAVIENLRALQDFVHGEQNIADSKSKIKLNFNILLNKMNKTNSSSWFGVQHFLLSLTALLFPL